MVDITKQAIDRYSVDRQDEGAANATINRELAALRRAFNLGKKAGLVGWVPEFDLLAENNVHKGFVEDGHFAAIIEALPEHLQPLAMVGLLTGWRKGELLSRRWCHVDLNAGWIRLEPGETKNGKGRQFPIIPRLREVLEARREQKLDTEKQTGRIVDALFFHYMTGKPVKNPRRAWETACNLAGHPGLLFHDLRRTAARNLIRAGIPQTMAMDLTGHITPDVFKRYAIVDEQMLEEAGEKLSRHLRRTEPERKVVPIGR